MKNNVGARWLRNMECGSNWAEKTGGAREQTVVVNREDETVRFTEIAGVVWVIGRENHVITISLCNQEGGDKKSSFSNLTGATDKASIVIEGKRKRSEIEQIKTGSEPVKMQLDGPQNTEEETRIIL